MKIKKLISLTKKNKKGVVGLDTSKAVILALMTLGIIGFVIVIALNELNSTSVSTAQTTGIVNNITGGVETFFGNAETWFSLLAVVVIILIVSIVIFAVNRFGDAGSGGGL